jgi:hypothetical protein
MSIQFYFIKLLNAQMSSEKSIKIDQCPDELVNSVICFKKKLLNTYNQ